MPTFTQDDVISQLRTVDDPELHKDLVTLDMVKSVEIDGATVRLQIELTTPACPMKDRIGGDIERLLDRLPADAGLVSVQDGHPANLEWLGSVRGQRMQSLGVAHFGQSGTIPELYRHYRIDAGAILDAAAMLLLGRLG